MDEEALAFLERWTEDNAAPISAKLRAEQAEILAVQCTREGADAGFSEEALEEAAAEATEGGDLVAYIEAALAKANEIEATDEDES